jgi:hypothetical protein
MKTMQLKQPYSLFSKYGSITELESEPVWCHSKKQQNQIDDDGAICPPATWIHSSSPCITKKKSGCILKKKIDEFIIIFIIKPYFSTTMTRREILCH